MSRTRAGGVPKRAKLPRNCPINFDFSPDRIECKTCRYFDTCLRVFTMAKRLAQNVR